MRIHLAALVAGAAVIVGCHSETTAPNEQASALAAAQTLLQLADSLETHGGDPAEIGAFRGLAGLVATTGRISTVTITLDSAPAEFLAMAQQMEQAACPPDMFCSAIALPPLQTFMAWQKNDPRRYVQLITTGSLLLGTSNAQSDPEYFSYPSGSTLSYMDSSGQLYIGASSGQPMHVSTSDTPCTTNDGPQIAIYPPLNCTRAEFTVAFSGTVMLAPFAFRSDSASAKPSHTLTMASQGVHGARLIVPAMRCTGCTDSTAPPRVTWPPIAFPPTDSLTSTLSASVGADVTFTFTVTNSSARPVGLHFDSGQQFDVRVWNASGGALLWRWSTDKSFTQALTSRTLAAGESATYVAQMPLPAKGSYRALGYLTSASHGAAAYTSLVVP